MVRAVIFDVDNTLYSYDDGHAAAWKAVLRYAEEKLGMDADTFEHCHDESVQQLNRRLGMPCGAMHSRSLRFLGLLEKQHLPLYHAVEMERLYWKRLIAVSRPEPGIEACLKALKENGYIVGVGTNMTLTMQLEKLEALGILRYMDFAVASEEISAEKPDQKFFACCRDKAGVAMEQCLFIGDHLQMDIIGAQNAGMTGLWYCKDSKSAEKYPEYYRISNYDQLREWCRKPQIIFTGV